jgi:hypothetical protein
MDEHVFRHRASRRVATSIVSLGPSPGVCSDRGAAGHQGIRSASEPSPKKGTCVHSTARREARWCCPLVVWRGWRSAHRGGVSSPLSQVNVTV